MVTKLPPIGHKLVPRSTPIHVSQLIQVLLKETFNTLGDETYPYRNIDFDTTYNKESLKGGKKPLVVVSCGDTTMQQISLGDVAAVHTPTWNHLKSSTVQSSVNIKVLSPNKAEVEIIGNELLNCLISIRTILPALTTILYVHTINMSQVNKVYRDLPHYYVQCTLTYTMQYIWTHTVTPQLMEEIIAHLIVNNEELIKL